MTVTDSQKPEKSLEDQLASARRDTEDYWKKNQSLQKKNTILEREKKDLEANYYFIKKPISWIKEILAKFK